MTNYPIAVMTMGDGAQVVLELHPEQAPNTVASFIWLANRGCFDGHVIQRVVPGYVLDMSYTAFNKPECKYLIANESRCQGVNNTLPVTVGSVCMGGYAEDEIAGGEFFFPFVYTPKLDGRYPAFGRVVSGWQALARLEHVPLRPVPNEQGIEINVPVTPVLIESVRVDCRGADYPEPIRLMGHKLPANWD